MAGGSPHQGYDDPHAGQQVVTAGPPLEDATAAVVMVHGRGATAEGFIEMAGEFDTGATAGVQDEKGRRHERGEESEQGGVAYLAPQARGRTWYPNDFRAPIEQNEPGLSSALGLLGDLCERVADAGIPSERTMFVGFSQGACLSSEFVARNARRYGGLAALSGGVIGPDGTPRDYPGSLGGERTEGSRSSPNQQSVGGTPVFIGCSDSAPQDRLAETRDVFERLGGDVEVRVYEGMAHTVNQDEIDYVSGMIAGLVEGE